MNQQRCRRCQQKWAQHPRGLCRACDRAAGSFAPLVHRPRTQCRRCGEESEPAEGLCTRCWQALADEVAAASARRAAAAPVVAPVRRERVVRGRVFEVVWDGSKR
jgi:predicted amidophosphoribosyltransferase